jgi:hypothetical protein
MRRAIHIRAAAQAHQEFLVPSGPTCLAALPIYPFGMTKGESYHVSFASAKGH